MPRLPANTAAMHVAAQITQFGTTPRSYRRDQLAVHIGGSVRVAEIERRSH